MLCHAHQDAKTTKLIISILGEGIGQEERTLTHWWWEMLALSNMIKIPHAMPAIPLLSIFSTEKQPHIQERLAAVFILAPNWKCQQ